MLIIEGSDKAGKTTLAKRLLQTREFKGLKHLGLLPPTWDYFDAYLNLVKDDIQNGPFIYDRFHYSELVYGPVIRGHVDPRFAAHERRCVERALLTAGSVLVHVDPPAEIVEQRVMRMGDDVIDADDVEGICRLYRTVVETSSLPTVVIRGNFDDRDLDLITCAHRKHRRQAETFRGVKTWGWGQLESPLLHLVGDQVSNPLGKRWPWAFSGHGGCSRYLSEVLEFAGIPERLVHLSNAWLPSTAQLTKGQTLWVGQELTIALGKSACQALCLHDIPHIDFYHPQYLRRFHTHRAHRFGTSLADLVEKGLEGENLHAPSRR